jgi:hypothetical protein
MQRRGWDWLKYVSLRDALTEGSDGRDKYFKPWLETIDKLDADGSMAAKTAAYWALTERFLEEKSKADGGVASLCYDEMVVKPKSTLNRVFSSLDLKASVNEEAFQSESMTTAKSRQGVSVPERLRSWEEELTVEQIEAVESNVACFAMEHRLDKAERIASLL